MANQVLLSDLIEGIRAEIETAMKKCHNRALKFTVGEIELEAQVVVNTGGTAGAKLNVYVFELGLDGATNRSVTHTVRMKLTPTAVTWNDQDEVVQGPVRISDQQPHPVTSAAPKNM